MPTGIIQFKRTYQAATPTTTGNLAVGAYSFKLNLTPGFSELQAAFDSYRICAASLNFVPLLATQGANNTSGNLHVAVDMNDAANPIGTSEIWQYPGYKMLPLNRPHTIYLKPRASQTVFRSGVANGYAMAEKGTWINTSNPDVEYYGVKYAIDQGAANAAVCAVYVTLYLQMKGVS